ncbi:DUF4336 domain-containing protein [Acidimangrovimonas pyrenivorans]|uniref:DUF4336 domain-containing protein n=1 Tax=Acidimangrovimonas pyrenivorans TaxID=2030798 RepID=A0ABV7ACH8_9RHOB
MALTPYIPDRLWLQPYPIRYAGTGFDARMSVLRLNSGEVMLHSPCEIPPTLAEEIAAIGPVAHIVAPGNYHYLHVPSAQAAFPEAKTWLCPGIETKRPDIRHDGLLGDSPPPAWADEVEQVLVRGSRWMWEVAMYDRVSRTLLLVDLIENFTDATPHASAMLKFWFKWVFGMWNRPRPAPEYRMGWRDRAAAADSLGRILDWPFERIVLSHGDLIESEAHDRARAAWRGVLERP